MRVQPEEADKHKTEATDGATPEKVPNPPEDRGFGGFGATLVSFVVALLGTSAVAALYDVSWGWSLVIFIIFGVTTTVALIGLVYWNEK